MSRRVVAPFLFLAGGFAGLAPAVAAKGLHAQVLCGVLEGGKVKFVVPTDDKRRIDLPIACAVHVEGSGGGPLKAFVYVTQGGDEKEVHYGAVGKGHDYEIRLQPGADFAACQDFVIDARVQRDDQDGPPLWEDKITVEQRCEGGGGAVAKRESRPSEKPIPVAPPVSSHHDVEVGSKWEKGELAKLPDEAARNVAQRFADAVTDGDPEAIGLLVGESTGFKVEKKKLSVAQMKKLISSRGFDGATGIRELFDCSDYDKHEGCKWGRWWVEPKGDAEFWIYNNDGSSYGPYRCATFRNDSGRWVWTGVQVLDLGPP